MKVRGLVKKVVHFLGAAVGLRSSFEALSRPRLYPGVSGGRTQSQDLQGSLNQLRDLGRDQERNNPYSRRYLSLIAINVIGRDGIQLRCNFHNRKSEPLERVNSELEWGFARWAKRGVCEASGKFSFVKVQELVARALKRDGEIFVRLLRGFDNEWGFALQLLMADRVDEGLNKTLSNGHQIIMGIEVDNYGRRVAYYLKDEAGANTYYGRRVSRIKADEILHVYDPTRADSERGYSEFSASINKLRMLHGCDEAQLTTMRVTAAKMGWLERTSTPPGSGINDEDDDVEIYEAEPGMIKELPPGYTIKETNWGSYDGDPDLFRIGQLKGAAAGLGVNYNDLAMDFSGVNYTSLRAAYLSDRDGYSLLQRVIIENFCQPVYEEWLKLAVLKDQFVSVKATNMALFMDPSWQGRGWEWVDPFKEARAAEIQKNNMLMSEDEIVSRRGADLEETYQKMSTAARMREKYGLTDLMKGEGKENANSPGNRGATSQSHRRAKGESALEDQ